MRLAIVVYDRCNGFGVGLGARSLEERGAELIVLLTEGAGCDETEQHTNAQGNRAKTAFHNGNGTPDVVDSKGKIPHLESTSQPTKLEKICLKRWT